MYLYGLIESVRKLGSYATDSVVQVSPSVQANINTIVDLSVKPVASVLLSLFAMMELFKWSTRADTFGISGNGVTRVELLGLSLLKIAIIIEFIHNLENIMWGLYEAGTQLMISIQSAAGTINPGGLTSMTIEQMKDLVAAQNYGVLDRILAYVGLIPVGIIISLTAIAVMVIFYGRLIEIYVMVALAPIPLSTMVHEEFSQIGKGFLKSFCAVVLQGAVIIIVLSLYSVIINEAMIDQANISAMMWGLAGYGILLVMALVGSSAMSKRILNAM